VLRAVLVMTIAGLLATRGLAAADVGPGEVDLCRDLAAEAARADRWNLAWQLTYTAGAVVQFGLAAAEVTDHDTTQTLWIGGASTAVGALGAWLTPLEIEVPSGSACRDRDAVLRAAERAAAEERQAFWLLHLGGVVVNGGAAVVTAERLSWQAGVLSFALGYPVSLLQIYTMPRAMWRRSRESSLTAHVMADDRRLAVFLGGSF